MGEIQVLIELLKKALKAKGVTYRDVAEALEMSEAGVKRAFSQKSFTLARFEEICKIAGTSIEKLATGISASQSESVHQYTLEQENLFANEPKCLAVFDLLLNGQTVKQILKSTKIAKSRLQKCLSKIESVGLIEWHANDRVKVLVSEVKWRENGPLRRKFHQLAKGEFLNHNFSGREDLFTFRILSLSNKSIQNLESEILEVINKYSESADSEKQLGFKRETIGVLCGVRKWNFSVLIDT